MGQGGLGIAIAESLLGAAGSCKCARVLVHCKKISVQDREYQMSFLYFASS